jgi:hypothetical protein
MSSEVIALLESQHDRIEELLDRIPREMGSVRAQAFLELRRLLAVHEAVERQLVHSKAKDEDAGAPDSRMHEEDEAAALLTTLEALDVESTEFETKFRGLRDAVLQHAEAEELTEFGELDGDFSNADADRIRAAVEQVESGVDAMEIPYAQMQERARAALRTSG